MKNEFYALNATNLQGKVIEMESYKSPVVLVVNTATKCGFAPQLVGLEKLYEKYKDSGFVVLGFPCNQFGNQEPGDEASIAESCSINYGVTFPIFAKVEVNGSGTHPVFQYLKRELRGIWGEKIKWNFTKFLIDRNGKPVKRFSPFTDPAKIESYIKKLL